MRVSDISELGQLRGDGLAVAPSAGGPGQRGGVGGNAGARDCVPAMDHTDHPLTRRNDWRI